MPKYCMGDQLFNKNYVSIQFLLKINSSMQYLVSYHIISIESV